ncbi:histone deacetylase complex subunit sap130-like [Plakobranchus ocellatus]|uniref:Histone deacetylase complex subunit sap130-like n=1 Tax=Plakobranchus ocellatus TaxID=259542 RepID=A0AAV3Z8B1_9GAST|nr:histone deacetylase complex subunit sap130-like [Plakobranchus ocellatus]
MSKNLQGDTKGEGVVGDGELHTIPSHMITSQASAAAPGLPLTRPALALQTPAQQTYIVQPHHEMKNYGKSTRPIAPAPPSQAFQNLTSRSAPQTNNIPSIIAPSVGSGGNPEPASAMGTVGHSSISVPVTLSQASVLTLTNPSSLGNTATIVQQGLQGSAIPINMLRGPVAQPQPQIQALQNLSHITRGAPTLSVPKSPALLRQTSPAAATTLQIPGGLPHTLSLPMARAPLLQTIKTTTAQVARPLSPAVGAQAQDLSRANFPLHGSITPASQGPMHITLNRVAAPANMNQSDNSPTTGGLSGTATAIPGRSVAVSAVTAGGLSSSTTSQNSDLQQPRMNVSVNQDPAANSGGVHHHIHHPLNNPHHHQHQIGRSSTLPFSGPPSSLSSMSSNKLPHPGLVQPAKVIPSHALQQQGAPPSIKSVNLPVPNPVMMNSINPGTIPVCIASSPAPIPIAKVTPQRQHVAGSIPLVSASVHSHIVSSAAAASSATSVASSVSTLPTAMAISSLPTSLPLTLSSSSFSPAGAPLVESTTGRQELAGLSVSQSSNGGIIITPDFQARSSGTIIPMTSLTTSGHGNTAPTAVSHTDNRPGGLTQPHQQQIGIGPDDPMWYQHIVYQHVSQSPLVSQPGAPTIVRPGPNAFALLPAHGKVQAQNSTLTALPVSSATPNLRLSAAAAGGTMMMVDPHRQQHHPQGAVLHPALSGASIPGNLVAEKLTNLSRQSAASGNVYTASVGVQSHMAGGGGGMGTGQSGGLSAVPVSNPSSSPRPSILRKRTSEPAGVVIRKPNFNLNQDHRCHSPPRVDTTSTTISSNTTSGSSPTPKISTKNYSPMSENSQSSTDTALSSNDATTPTNNHNDKSKGEGEEGMENGPSQTSHVNNIPASPAVSHTGSLSEASPRKRARKQSLHANEELKDNSSSEDEMETAPMKKRDDVSKEQRLREKEIERRGEYTDEEGVRWILHKPKPTFVLLQPDVINNKTRNNHFVKYGDVKPKEERRPTVNELSNQKGIMQKVNGWKLYFSASQLEELEDFEKEMQSHFLDVQKDLAKVASHKTGSEDSLKIHEISQANIQRCELIQSQLSEARGAMLRTLEHQPRIHQIVNKHMSKRPIKKKERT